MDAQRDKLMQQVLVKNLPLDAAHLTRIPILSRLSSKIGNFGHLLAVHRPQWSAKFPTVHILWDDDDHELVLYTDSDNPTPKEDLFAVQSWFTRVFENMPLLQQWASDAQSFFSSMNAQPLSKQHLSEDNSSDSLPGGSSSPASSSPIGAKQDEDGLPHPDGYDGEFANAQLTAHHTAPSQLSQHPHTAMDSNAQCQLASHDNITPALYPTTENLDESLHNTIKTDFSESSYLDGVYITPYATHNNKRQAVAGVSNNTNGSSLQSPQPGSHTPTAHPATPPVTLPPASLSNDVNGDYYNAFTPQSSTSCNIATVSQDIPQPFPFPPIQENPSATSSLPPQQLQQSCFYDTNNNLSTPSANNLTMAPTVNDSTAQQSSNFPITAVTTTADNNMNITPSSAPNFTPQAASKEYNALFAPLQFTNQRLPFPRQNTVQSNNRDKHQPIHIIYTPAEPTLFFETTSATSSLPLAQWEAVKQPNRPWARDAPYPQIISQCLRITAKFNDYLQHHKYVLLYAVEHMTGCLITPRQISTPTTTAGTSALSTKPLNIDPMQRVPAELLFVGSPLQVHAALDHITWLSSTCNMVPPRHPTATLQFNINRNHKLIENRAEWDVQVRLLQLRTRSLIRLQGTQLSITAENEERVHIAYADFNALLNVSREYQRSQDKVYTSRRSVTDLFVAYIDGYYSAFDVDSNYDFTGKTRNENYLKHSDVYVVMSPPESVQPVVTSDVELEHFNNGILSRLKKDSYRILAKQGGDRPRPSDDHGFTFEFFSAPYRSPTGPPTEVVVMLRALFNPHDYDNVGKVREWLIVNVQLAGTTGSAANGYPDSLAAGGLNNASRPPYIPRPRRDIQPQPQPLQQQPQPPQQQQPSQQNTLINNTNTPSTSSTMTPLPQTVQYYQPPQSYSSTPMSYIEYPSSAFMQPTTMTTPMSTMTQYYPTTYMEVPMGQYTTTTQPTYYTPTSTIMATDTNTLTHQHQFQPHHAPMQNYDISVLTTSAQQPQQQPIDLPQPGAFIDMYTTQQGQSGPTSRPAQGNRNDSYVPPQAQSAPPRRY